MFTPTSRRRQASGFVITLELVLLTTVMFAVIIGVGFLVKAWFLKNFTFIHDSSTPPFSLGGVINYDICEAPVARMVDSETGPALGRFFTVAVRPDRVSSRNQVFYSAPDCSGVPHLAPPGRAPNIPPALTVGYYNDALQVDTNGDPVGYGVGAPRAWVPANPLGPGLLYRTTLTTLPVTPVVIRSIWTSTAPDCITGGDYCVGPANLVNWWPGDGNTDDVVSGANGTLQNGATFSAGQFAQSFTFDGVDDHITLPGVYGGGPEATVAAWVRTNAVTGDFQAVVSPTDLTFVHFQLNNAGNIAVYTDVGGIALPIVPVLPTGVWRHVAVVMKSGDLRVHVDGALVGSDATAFTTILPSATVRIGSGFGGGRFFAGEIEEVMIFDRALTVAEVADLAGGPCKPITEICQYIGTRSLAVLPTTEVKNTAGNNLLEPLVPPFVLYP